MDLGLIDHVKKQVQQLIKNNKRIDGRGLLEYRKPISIRTGIYKNAEGSCLVNWGKTKVAAGVKLEIGEPFPDIPDQGILIVSAEFLPGAYPTYEPGPPGPTEIELARVVDRGIREAEMINLERLCIKPGEKVWIIFLDIYVLNDDGNLYDASNLAALGALLNTRFPKYDPEKDQIDYKTKTDEKLEIRNLPISVTFGKIGDKIILDPSKIEEQAMDGGITITFTEDGNIRAIQKYGSCTFTDEELVKILDWGLERSRNIRRKLKQAIKF